MKSISNNNFKISVQKKGAELCSILSLKTGKEFMWNGNPEIWGSFAPVLFPIIGALKDGEFEYDGTYYSVPKHGFIRNNENLVFKKLSDSTIEYSLKFDKESLKQYPFKFEFFIRFSLNENQIKVEHEVINHCNQTPMYFSVGGHPAFKCPLNEDEVYEDYFLEFEKVETIPTWGVLSSGLIDTTTSPLLDNSSILSLKNNLFENDALILKEHLSNKVSLKSKKSTTCLSVEYVDFPYLGIWAKPNAPFVCIEPWLGISDSCDTDQDFKTKEGILKLDKQSSFKASYTITIQE